MTSSYELDVILFFFCIHHLAAIMQTIQLRDELIKTRPAEIGKAYFTAIIWVSRNRYTYCTDDGNYIGHCTELDERKFRRALALEVFCLHLKGYEAKIKHLAIEG